LWMERTAVRSIGNHAAYVGRKEEGPPWQGGPL
jgi:hypothetical protein